jgi:KaiC/GvpD/RAD55 family RecA-like ATPase
MLDAFKTTETLQPDLIDGLLPAGKYVFLASDPRVGKSVFSMYLACCLLLGRSVFDLYPVPRRARHIVIFNAEENHEDVQELMFKLLRGLGVDPDSAEGRDARTRLTLLDRRMQYSGASFSLEAEHAPWVSRVLTALQPDVVIFDSLSSLTTGELNGKDAERVGRQVLQYVIAYKCTALVLCHFAKADPSKARYTRQRFISRIGGSVHLVTPVDACWALHEHRDKNGGRQIEFQAGFFRMRGDEHRLRYMLEESADRTSLQLLVVEEEDRVDPEAVILYACAQAAPLGVEKTVIQEALRNVGVKWSYKTLDKHLRRLVRERKLLTDSRLKTKGQGYRYLTNLPRDEMADLGTDTYADLGDDPVEEGGTRADHGESA